MATPRQRLVVAAFLATAAISFAQRTDPVNLEELSPGEALALAPDWLRHGDARQRAWAAYWIQRYKQEQEVPQLLEALASYQEDMRGWRIRSNGSCSNVCAAWVNCTQAKERRVCATPRLR